MYQYFFKRVFDIILSSILIILLFPLFILISITIIINDRTFNIFYLSLRTGMIYNDNKNVKMFKMYKFRTMCIGCEESLPFIKVKNDERITKIGKILRYCSLDELPQLFNVLKGDMSIIGNRPMTMREAAELFEVNRFDRFKVQVGMTGFWQINKHKAITLEDRIKMDEEYASNISFSKDLYILLLTPIYMFRNF